MRYAISLDIYGNNLREEFSMKSTKKKLKKSNNVITNSLAAYICPFCSMCSSCNCNPTTNQTITANVRQSNINGNQMSMLNPGGNP